MSLASDKAASQSLSYSSGPTDKPIWTVTLGALAEIQAEIFGDRTALAFPWQNERRTYRELFLRGNTIAKALVESGMQYGDCVGIFAGNCVSYLEVFLGASFIGCPVVVLNSNYTPSELEFTVGYSGEYDSHISTCLLR
jgi:acyl-CoA synthetase (AMP-forming)/AMP-acid ligase II